MLLDILTKAFDQFTALKVGAALVFSIITIPFFLLAKKLSGNNIVSAIVTIIFVLFLSNTEMISWGGNPNFLAFSFMLLAVYFIVDLLNKPSKKNIVLTGLFLSLIIGTHILVTIVMFGILALFAVLSFVFMKNRKNAIKGSVKNIFFLFLTVLFFSLPYVTFYLTYFKNSANEMAQTHLFSLPNIPSLVSLLTGTWFSLVEFIALISIGTTGLFWLAKNYRKEKKSNAILLSSFFIVPLFLFFATSQPLRWLYFLPIPFLLCFSIYLKDLFADVKFTKKTTITLFAVLFMVAIVVLSIQTGIDRLDGATQYYQFIKQDEVEALNWIRNDTALNSVFATSGHASNVGGGGNSYAWWVEGYANRICMFTGDLDYYSFQFERDNVKVTNRIFAGTYVANYSNIEVADSFPAGVNNPHISALIGNKYEDLFTINDMQNQVFTSPIGDNQTMTVAAGYTENGNANATYSNSTATITVTYEQPDFELTRSVIMGEDKASIDVVYHITPKNSTLKEFKINLWSLFDIPLENTRIDKDAVVTLTQMYSKDAQAVIKIVENSGELTGARVIFENPKNSKPVINYQFEPLQNDLYVHLKISINLPTSKPIDNNQTIGFYDAYSQLKDLNVNSVRVSKYRSEEYQRFLLDTSHFSVAFQNGSIIIFKVIS